MPKKIRHLDNENQLQYEKLRDTRNRFVAERYNSNGFYYHFHMNPELYCVINGSVTVTIDGDSRRLTNWEMALVSGLESHAYGINGYSDIAYFHIGTAYTEPFRKIYGGTAPARWLTDKKFNQQEIYPIVEQVIKHGHGMSELEKVSYANLLLARIINQYGVKNDRSYFVSTERENSVSEIIQYIYDHSDEDLNLNTLSKQFNCAPQSLSRKLSKYIKTDLRVFINDVRAQKVIQLLNDDRYNDMSLMEIVSYCGFNSVSTFYRSYHRNFKYMELKNTTRR